MLYGDRIGEVLFPLGVLSFFFSSTAADWYPGDPSPFSVQHIWATVGGLETQREWHTVPVVQHSVLLCGSLHFSKNHMRCDL